MTQEIWLELFEKVWHTKWAEVQGTVWSGRRVFICSKTTFRIQFRSKHNFHEPRIYIYNNNTRLKLKIILGIGPISIIPRSELEIVNSLYNFHPRQRFLS